MDYSTKFQISRLLTLCGSLVGIYCLYRVITLGLANPHAAMPWFWGLIASILITAPACILYYYYRSRRLDTKTQQQIAIETLAKLGQSKGITPNNIPRDTKTTDSNDRSPTLYD